MSIDLLERCENLAELPDWEFGTQQEAHHIVLLMGGSERQEPCYSHMVGRINIAIRPALGVHELLYQHRFFLSAPLTDRSASSRH